MNEPWTAKKVVKTIAFSPLLIVVVLLCFISVPVFWAWDKYVGRR